MKNCLTLVLGMALLSATGTPSHADYLHLWRFENSPGFLNDSVGAATLTSNSQVSQVALPSGARGQNFPSSFSGIGSNSSAADFSGVDSTGLFATNITSVNGDFTIELFAHLDNISGSFGEVLAGQFSSANNVSQISWALESRIDGRFGTQPGEFLLITGDGSTLIAAPSGIVLTPNTDFFLAASFDLTGGQVTFHVQNLTLGTALQTVTVAHTATSLNSETRFNIGDSSVGFDFAVDGLIDEVRFSDMVLTTNQLLINASGPQTAVIPEPSSIVLLGMGALGLVGYAGWRRKRPASAETGPRC